MCVNVGSIRSIEPLTTPPHPKSNHTHSDSHDGDQHAALLQAPARREELKQQAGASGKASTPLSSQHPLLRFGGGFGKGGSSGWIVGSFVCSDVYYGGVLIGERDKLGRAREIDWVIQGRLFSCVGCGHLIEFESERECVVEQQTTCLLLKVCGLTIVLAGYSNESIVVGVHNAYAGAGIMS